MMLKPKSMIFLASWMKIDVDGSGEIDYDEFIGAIVKNKIKNYL